MARGLSYAQIRYREVVDRPAIEAILTRAEEALAGSGPVDLSAVGFWRAVGQVKRQPAEVGEYASRVAAIDRRAFERRALVRVPIGLGTLLMSVATAAGLALIGLGYGYRGLTQAALLLIGTGIILVTTHGLTHLVVGRLQGMRFTHWFIASPRRPQPGVKVDYATYLRVPPQRRAWMHASGAITTKVIPLVGLGAGVAMEADGWVLWLLGVVTLGQLLTDLIWSTKASDWKKYLRERAISPGG